MFDSLIEKVAVVVAAKVSEEVVKRLPEVSAAVIELLPGIVDGIVDQILDHLSVLPFIKRT